jgi:DNA-binding MarR family transcriptional regulator
MGGLFDRLQDEIDSREEPGGLSPIDLLDMSPELAAVIQQIIRKNGMKLDQIAAALDQSPQETQKVLDELVEKGFVRRVEVKEELWYKAHFGRKADKTLHQSVWAALDSIVEEDEEH